MGIITILLAGAAAIFEMDMKKVIALSTLRQLGVIIMILGGMEPVLSFFPNSRSLERTDLIIHSMATANLKKS